jgi:predicted N-formylglutamate amidohydrolase
MLRIEDTEGKPVVLSNQSGATRLAIVCEHASSFIPAEFNGLGLSADVQKSHIAWDPGAFAVAHHIATEMDAPLLVSGVSRLVYDCNRPPEAAGAMPLKSEDFAVPGNQGLSDSEKQNRTDAYYRPFEQALSALMQTGIKALVTIHSFTPIYFGAPRAVELGILHDSDTRLADAMLAHAPVETHLLTQRNVPYGPSDGVTHTLKIHGVDNGVANVMLEIRNDLLTNPEACHEVAQMLVRILRKSLADIGFNRAEETEK